MNAIVKNYPLVLCFQFICLIASLHAQPNAKELSTCELDAPVITGVTAEFIEINSQVSGDVNFTPNTSTIDVLFVQNNGSGQVDFKITAAVHITTIRVVNTNNGSVKFRAGGNFPYPTITYCTVNDPDNSATFESSVSQTGEANLCATDDTCYASGSLLSDISVTASDTVLWYDAAIGGNLLAANEVITDGTIYYAANSNNVDCESSRTLYVGCIEAVADETPFNCDYYAYLFQNNDVYAVNLASGTALEVAVNITPGNINAAGYNNTDGFIWGSLSDPARSIVRIGKNFNTDVFYVPELPSTNRYVGDIDANGIYFLKGGLTTVYKIDLNPASSNYAKSIGTMELSSSPLIHDWAFNAVDGYLYTVEKNSNILYRIDSQTGTVTAIGEVPILSGNNYTYGAVYFDASGNFYMSSNQTGTIYIAYEVHTLEVNGAINSNLFASGPSSSLNDGARCPTAIVPQEDCGNGIDDDGDGLVDCDDMSCSGILDCEVITPVTTGNNGGLESNNRLSQKITQRNFMRAKTNYTFQSKTAKKIKKKSNYAKKSGRQGLHRFIPLETLNNTFAVESSPEDLLDITNADEIISVDYIRGAETVAALLAIETNEGVYEHTKYICDRLLGAEILSISSIELLGHPFIKTQIKHPNGEKETVVSFAVQKHTDHFEIDSHWNIDAYDSDFSHYNFQLWSNNVDDLHALASEILNLVEIQKPITKIRTGKAPVVYVKKGHYNGGQLELTVVNTNQSEQIKLKGGIRKTETDGTEEMALDMSLENSKYISSVKVETGTFFDAGFRITAGKNTTPDDVFVSDGPWGVDAYANSTQVEEFEIMSEQRAKETKSLHLERSVSLKASTAEYVGVYKAFTPRFQAVDLAAFNTFEINAKGNGMLTVMLLKNSIYKWEEQHKVQIMLSPDKTDYQIPLNSFKNHRNETIDANDITTVLFTMESSTGTQEEKNLELSGLSFTNNENIERIISQFDSESTQKIMVTPSENSEQMNFSFISDTDASCSIEVYNINGQRKGAYQTTAKQGLNVFGTNMNNWKVGVYIVKISSSSQNYKPSRFIVVK